MTRKAARIVFQNNIRINYATYSLTGCCACSSHFLHFAKKIDELPSGAYTSFAADKLEDTDWMNADDFWIDPEHKQPGEPAQWVIDTDHGGHRLVRPDFQPSRHLFGSKALMRSKQEFPPIAYYHSVPHSEYFESCYVSLLSIRSTKQHRINKRRTKLQVS